MKRVVTNGAQMRAAGVPTPATREGARPMGRERSSRRSRGWVGEIAPGVRASENAEHIWAVR